MKDIKADVKFQERIKDVGITQNGVVFVTEKGEVHLAYASEGE